jgi:hypothetical protein
VESAGGNECVNLRDCQLEYVLRCACNAEKISSEPNHYLVVCADGDDAGDQLLERRIKAFVA